MSDRRKARIAEVKKRLTDNANDFDEIIMELLKMIKEKDELIDYYEKQMEV